MFPLLASGQIFQNHVLNHYREMQAPVFGGEERLAHWGIEDKVLEAGKVDAGPEP